MKYHLSALASKNFIGHEIPGNERDDRNLYRGTASSRHGKLSEENGQETLFPARKTCLTTQLMSQIRKGHSRKMYLQIVG